jgi:hypothetical protein
MNEESICMDLDCLRNGERLWNRRHGQHSCSHFRKPAYVKQILKPYYEYMQQKRPPELVENTPSKQKLTTE